MATPAIASSLKRGFPRSLDGVPMLLPTDDTAIRRMLDQWLEQHELRPLLVGEFEDYALLREFARAGHGFAPVHAVQEAQFTTLGLSPGFLLAVLAGATQLAGGGLLLAGLLTRWAALALMIYCGIGIWADHGRWGFFLNWIVTPGRGHGVEYMVVLLGALTFVLLHGGGEWSMVGPAIGTKS